MEIKFNTKGEAAKKKENIYKGLDMAIRADSG